MSISFFMKDLRKEKSLMISEILKIGENLSQYSLNTAEKKINKCLHKKLGEFECILLGEEGRSARGFEFSYDNHTRLYRVKLYIPSSLEDWRVAFEFMKKIGKVFGDTVTVDENMKKYHLNSIELEYPYLENIKYGLLKMEEHFKIKGDDSYRLFGIHRQFALNKKILEGILAGETPIEDFSEMITYVQYLDIFSVKQRFYRDNANEVVFGTYLFTPRVKTLLPYKPIVEYENLKFIKNEEVSFWRVLLSEITEENIIMPIMDMDYFEFIKKLPPKLYSFVDSDYILIAPLSEEEILKICK